VPDPAIEGSVQDGDENLAVVDEEYDRERF
jgi:hypothetical protein